jgi:hypothetical protein
MRSYLKKKLFLLQISSLKFFQLKFNRFFIEKMEYTKMLNYTKADNEATKK